MKFKDFQNLPIHIKNEVIGKPYHCPYQNGKLKLSQYKKYTIEQIQKILQEMKPNEFPDNYNEFLIQNNMEKEIEYNINNQIMNDRIQHAFEYNKKDITNYVLSHDDITYLGNIPYDTVYKTILSKFEQINAHMGFFDNKKYEKGILYTHLLSLLEKVGFRKTAQGFSTNAFDSLKGKTILNQLSTNTYAYLQYFSQIHSDNNNYIANLKDIKAPKFRYFSGQFGGQIERNELIYMFFEAVEKNKTTSFYDDNEKYGISKETLTILEEKLKKLDHIVFSEEETLSDIFLPDENIYGCPVINSFTKIYQIILISLLERK